MPRYILRDATIRDRAAAVVAKLPLEPVLAVTIGPYEPTRSGEQNRLYWALLTQVAAYIPDEHGELHGKEWWSHFLRVSLGDGCYVDGTMEYRLRDGGTVDVPVPKSTTRMTVPELSGLITEIEAWAAGYGVGIDGQFSEVGHG